MSGGTTRTTVTAGFRQRRSPIAATALLCQAMLLALSLSALCAVPAEAREHECTHGHGASCPMHRNSSDPEKKGYTTCGRKADVAILTLLFGIADVAPSPTGASIVSLPTVLRGADVRLASLRPAPPDPPPPLA
jgi:hypothetical protein